MRFEDDKYFDEEDNDLWDDELELTADDDRPAPADMSRQPYEPHTPYSPYDADDTEQSTPAYEDEEPAPETPAREYDGSDDYYSDPEPKSPSRPRRRGFFRKREEEEEDEDDGNDYYDSDHEPEPRPKVKEPKAPKLDPEDPDYWIDEEESPLSGLMPNPGKPWIWKLVAGVAALLALAGGWVWFLRPYADSAVKYGYIRNMERRGALIKTFEGTLIPYKELGDPDPLYFQEIRFSVPTDSLAAHMKRMMLGGVPVRVEYETYNTPLPWKGEERIVVVKADTADPRKILPPEYR